MSNFHKNFYWGAATSSHQVEGNNHNDWTEFEQRIATSKSQMAREKDWPDYILKNYPNPLQEENYISGKACDHYNRFREDFDIAKSLGHNAHRFSIEWSRIEPEEGKFDEKEIEHYREVIKTLREKGMEPFVTLWHWTLPLWVAKKGGWENRQTINHFVRYCEKIALELRKDVRFFVTINEPLLWASNAYRTGKFPPQKRNIFLFVRVFWNLYRAHAAVYRKMKVINPDFSIGIANNTAWFSAQLLRPVYWMINLFFVRKIKGVMDFSGIQYYRRISFILKNKEVSDFGWEIYPEGFYDVIKKYWKNFGKPIFILENGVADARDIIREKFIRDHIAAMKKAMDEGVDVRGYFYWSLLDNFEWDSGFWPRFGLVEVDYKTMERKVRKSAKIYTDIIRK